MLKGFIISFDLIKKLIYLFLILGYALGLLLNSTLMLFSFEPELFSIHLNFL